MAQVVAALDHPALQSQRLSTTLRIADARRRHDVRWRGGESEANLYLFRTATVRELRDEERAKVKGDEKPAKPAARMGKFVYLGITDACGASRRWRLVRARCGSTRSTACIPHHQLLLSTLINFPREIRPPWAQRLIIHMDTSSSLRRGIAYANDDQAAPTFLATPARSDAYDYLWISGSPGSGRSAQALVATNDTTVH